MVAPRWPLQAGFFSYSLRSPSHTQLASQESSSEASEGPELTKPSAQRRGLSYLSSAIAVLKVFLFEQGPSLFILLLSCEEVTILTPTASRQANTQKQPPNLPSLYATGHPGGQTGTFTLIP